MTNNLITLTIPNDDSVALFHLGKSLIGMSSTIDGCPEWVVLSRDQYDALARIEEATGDLQQIAPRMMQELRCEGEELQGKRKEPEIDTTAQQVESLAVPGATHVITEQVKVGDPVSVDGGLSQGYITTIEEIANPVDKTNTPWDERIHSASKALNADGTWRLRRKPKDMPSDEWEIYVAYVQDELSHAMESFDEQVIMEEDSQQADLTVHIDPTREEANELIEASDAMLAEIRASIEPPVTPPGDDFHTDAGTVTEQNVAGIPPIPVPPPVVVPPAPVADEQAWDFPKLMKFLTERHGKIDVPTVNQLLAVDGLAALTDLNVHPDKIGPFVARVKAHLGE